MTVDRKMLLGKDEASFVDITKRLLEKYDDAHLADLYYDMVADISIEVGREQHIADFERDLAQLIKRYALGTEHAYEIRVMFSDQNWNDMAHTIREDIDSFLKRARTSGGPDALLDKCKQWPPMNGGKTVDVVDDDDVVLHAWIERYVD